MKREMSEWLVASKSGAWMGVRLKRGFTLIELLVVIAIISILASLLVPAVQTALGRAESISCQQKLHSVGTASHAFAGDHEGRFASVGMIHGWDTEENETFAQALGQDTMQEVKDAGILTCPTALKVGLSQGVKRSNITFAGNRMNYWSLGQRQGSYDSYGTYPTTYRIDHVRPTMAGFAFCGDGRWWLAADGMFFGQQPTFLHGDATVANMPNLNFMGGTCNTLFADGHSASMRPGWGADAANPEPNQIPCERPAGSKQGAWNAFWFGK